MTSKTILIADDDRDLVGLLAARCRQLGLEVVVAYDAMSALSLAHCERPDVVCLDVSMPGGDGLGVAEMLCGDDQLRHTPMIMLTGSTDEQTIRRCHSLCAYYVPKAKDVWDCIRLLLCEILDITPAEPARVEPDRRAGHDDPPKPSGSPGQLRRLVDIISREMAQSQQAESFEVRQPVDSARE